MESDYDLIIIGGGCAGLSLAMRLAKLGAGCPRVAIIEQRKCYVHDRTWSYWATASAQLTHLAQAEWKNVSVGESKQRCIVDCHDAPYQTIRSGVFYESALSDISLNKRIDLFLGESVEAMHKKNNFWEATISNRTLVSSQVVDTRSPKSATTPILWQSFSGIEVVCIQEVFNDEVATLMDFTKDTAGEIGFLYLLPYSRKRALIEATVFGKQAKTQSELAVMLEELVKKSVGSATYEIKYREHFAIPMGLPECAQIADESYVTVGLESGGARASTGYVFQRIQRWAEVATEKLRQGRKVSGHKCDSLMIRKMDRLFLRVLERHPTRAPEIFIRLFSLSDSGAVIRFMNDEPTIMDIVRIIRVLPSGLFIKELVKGIFR